MSKRVISVISDAATDVGFTPKGDRLLRCREMTQQNRQAGHWDGECVLL